MQQQILDALRRGAHDDAVDMARQFAAGSPADPEALRLLSVAQRAAGDIAGARATIDRALALAPEDAELHYARAGLLLHARELDEAGVALSETVKLDPNSFKAYIVQAMLAMARGDREEARRLARLAARLDAEHPWLRGVEGELALRDGDADTAVATLAKASARAPQDAHLLYMLGLAYLAKDHLAFAEQALSRVVAMDPGSSALRGLIADVLVRQGRSAEAADCIAPLLAERGDSLKGLRRYAGELELAAGRPERALPLLRQALEANPDDARALAALVELWRFTRDHAQARETLDALLVAAPENDAIWRARLGFEPEAGEAAFIERWRGARPDSVPAMEAELTMHARGGSRARAVAVAEAVLARQPDHVGAVQCVVEADLAADPARAIERLDALLASPGPRMEPVLLRTWLGVACDRAGDHGRAAATWAALQAEVPRVLPLPAPTSVRGDWPAAPAPDPGAPAVAFLFGPPGSMVERVAVVLGSVSPSFRSDRFSAQAPRDGLQDLDIARRLASGEVAAAAIAGSWRQGLAARSVTGAVIDWLPWWDLALVPVLRAAAPGATLILALRDPRDMLLEWLAFGSPVPFRMETPEIAARWLAAVLEGIGVLHEQDLVPHRLLRLDDIVDAPGAIAAAAGEVLGAPIGPPAIADFGPRHFAPGHWRAYGPHLAGAFELLTPVAVRLGYPTT